MNVHDFLRLLSASDKEALETYRPLAHKRIVITGKLDEGVLRETLAETLYRWGAVMETAVHSSTDVLLAVDPERMTVKRKDAARYGVTVMDEAGFVRWLADLRDTAESEAARLETYTAPPPPPAWFVEPMDDDFEDVIVPLSDFGA